MSCLCWFVVAVACEQAHLFLCRLFVHINSVPRLHLFSCVHSVFVFCCLVPAIAPRHPLHPGVYPNNTISLYLTRSGNKSTGIACGLLKGAILTKCEEIFNSVPDGGPFTHISCFCVPSCVLWQPRAYRVLHNAVCCRVVLWTVFRLRFRSSNRELSAPL